MPCRNWPRAPDSHRQARRHAVGHLQPVPEVALALARAVGMNLEQIRTRTRSTQGRSSTSTRPAAGRACASAGDRPGRQREALAARAFQRPGRRSIPSIPFHLIEPFLTEAVIFPANELRRAAHRRHAGRPRRAARANGPTCAARSRRSVSSASSASPRHCATRRPRKVLGYEGHLRRRGLSTRARRKRATAPTASRDRAGDLHRHRRRWKPAWATAWRRCRRARVQQLRAPPAGRGPAGRSSRSTATG